MKSQFRHDSQLPTVGVAFLCAILIFTTVMPIDVAHAASQMPSAGVSDCIRGAGNGVATAVIGTAILVGLDCLFLACAITATTLAGAGAASIGVGAATTALAVKGGVTAAAMGCARATVVAW